MASNIQTIKFPDGDTYTGEVKNGVPHGKGKVVYVNGDVYEGDFAPINGAFLNGNGRYTHANGSWNEGVFKDGNFVGGKVRLLKPDGSVGYEGEYSNGNNNGHGKSTLADGSVYVGNFIDGERTGSGKLTRPNGTVFDGEFDNGKFIRGVVFIKYENGTVYTGGYVNDKYTGDGKLLWPNGDVYEGAFLDSKYHGRGKLTYVSGKVCEGEFVNGKFVDAATSKSPATDSAEKISVFGFNWECKRTWSATGEKTKSGFSYTGGAGEVLTIHNDFYEFAEVKTVLDLESNVVYIFSIDVKVEDFVRYPKDVEEHPDFIGGADVCYQSYVADEEKLKVYRHPNPNNAPEWKKLTWRVTTDKSGKCDLLIRYGTSWCACKGTAYFRNLAYKKA